jgi:hypothetical protein
MSLVFVDDLMHIHLGRFPGTPTGERDAAPTYSGL